MRCSGIVAAFGVPDDAVYDTFEFSKFFRKNVNLIASVIPDPDTVRDFFAGCRQKSFFLN